MSTPLAPFIAESGDRNIAAAALPVKVFGARVWNGRALL